MLLPFEHGINPNVATVFEPENCIVDYNLYNINQKTILPATTYTLHVAIFPWCINIIETYNKSSWKVTKIGHAIVWVAVHVIGAIAYAYILIHVHYCYIRVYMYCWNMRVYCYNIRVYCYNIRVFCFIYAYIVCMFLQYYTRIK